MAISEMKDRFDWEELRLFLAVARASGLAGAARETGISAPTLGRQMTALERRLNVRLFERRQTGYELTKAGRELYRRAIEMESAATGIERWLSGQAERRVVRVAAGAWTSRFLALHMDQIWATDDPMTYEFLTGAARLDIAHRQADIGIRNRAPEESGLSGRRTNDVAYAVYRARRLPADANPGWIGVIGDGGLTPSARWTASRYADNILINCTDPRMVADLLHAGIGQAVLPCFVGDSFPELRRSGGTIDELAEQQWMVLNDAERHQPAVRLAIDRIVALLDEHRALFRGEKPATP
ncbi:MAG TPA: LysR family transcriptional regulator [Bauldia sp.]|nr:LysR family transcriptional regulator [Bauldia sp.]